MIKNARIITFDIETAPIKAYTWTLYPPYLSHDNIVEDWSIICGAWKFLGEDKIHATAVKTVGDDYEVVKKLRDVLSEADIIIGHNSDKFDIKKLNARMVFHNIDPLPNIPTIDTKKEAKKIGAFTSNRLDYLGKHLLGDGKIHVDFSLWLKVIAGSKKALKEMVEYNKIDVLRDEELYLKLRPYIKNHPHVGVIAGESKLHSCPNCGSKKIKRNGVRPTRAGVLRQECQCKDCGSYFRLTIPK